MTRCPDRNQSLYRTFAALDTRNEQSIVRFANRYGLLGLCRSTHERLLYHTCVVHVREGQADGESLLDWQNAVLDMKRAVRLWDLLSLPANNPRERAERDSQLHKCIVWQGDTAVVYKDADRSDLIAVEMDKGRHFNIGIFDQSSSGYCTTGNSLKPAMWYLQLYINERITGIGPRLLWTPGNRKNPQFYDFASTLLAAMWYQLGLEIVEPERRKQAYCAVCHKKFPCERRSAQDRSNTCRQRAVRAKARLSSDREQSQDP